jgi:hypothetical protein
MSFMRLRARSSGRIDAQLWTLFSSTNCSSFSMKRFRLPFRIGGHALLRHGSIILNTLRLAAVIRSCADPNDPRSGRAKPSPLRVRTAILSSKSL